MNNTETKKLHLGKPDTETYENLPRYPNLDRDCITCPGTKSRYTQCLNCNQNGRTTKNKR